MNRFMLLVVITKILIVVAAAWGEHVEIVCTVRQNCTPFACQTIQARGSGVTIGKLRDGRDAILTCAHVVRGSTNATISWYNGAAIPAQILANGDVDGLDVALLAARLQPEATECLPLTETPPARDADVRIYGFPGGYNDILTIRGKLLGTTIRAEKEIKQGMSGGAVVYNKQLAGIVWGCEAYRPCNGEYTPSWLIQPWLTKRLGYVPSCSRPRETPSPPASSPSTIPTSPAPPSEPSPRPPGEFAAVLGRVQSLEAAVESLKQQIANIPRNTTAPNNNESVNQQLINQLELQVKNLQAELRTLKQVKFPVRTLKPDGSIFSEEVVKLGDPIELRLVPRKQ